MATKTVDLLLEVRDAEGVVNVTHPAIGSTEDEGVTVVIPIGYIPPLEESPIADLRMTLIPLAQQVYPTALVSRVNDPEAGTSTLTFSFT